MAKFTFDQYAEQLRRDGGLVDEAVEVIRKTVKLHGPRIVQAEVQAVTPRIPVDRGTYRRSWRFEDMPGGAVVYNFSPHAPVIELGRRAGGRMPPLSVIADWVRRKGVGARRGPQQQVMVTRMVKGKAQQVRKKLRFKRYTDSELRGIAFVVARAIKARGLPAHHILRLASAKLAKVVGGELAKMQVGRPESRE